MKTNIRIRKLFKGKVYTAYAYDYAGKITPYNEVKFWGWSFDERKLIARCKKSLCIQIKAKESRDIKFIQFDSNIDCKP